MRGVPKEAKGGEGEEAKPRMFNVADKQRSTAGSVTVNMITPHNPQSWPKISVCI